MRVLVVSREVCPNRASPFVEEQVASLRSIGAEVDVYLVAQGGGKGYLAAARELRAIVRASQKYDIAHGHGPCAVCLTPIREIPFIATYHGSDIMHWPTRIVAAWTALRAGWNVFVSEELRLKALFRGRRSSVIPCGVDTDLFYPADRDASRLALGWDLDQKVALFAGRFDVPVKNAPLAQNGVQIWGGRLVELKGYSREGVAQAMNAADALVLTSIHEGSPQVIKEAMACNTPIVSTDVGDVAIRTNGVSNVAIVEPAPESVAEALGAVAGRRSNGRDRVLATSGEIVAQELMRVYESVAR